MTQIKHIIITKIRFNIVKLILILTKIIILFKYRQINIDLNKMSSLILIFKKLNYVSDIIKTHNNKKLSIAYNMLTYSG